MPDIPDVVLLPVPGEIPGYHYEQRRTDLVLCRMAPDTPQPVHALALPRRRAPRPRCDSRLCRARWGERLLSASSLDDVFAGAV